MNGRFMKGTDNFESSYQLLGKGELLLIVLFDMDSYGDEVSFSRMHVQLSRTPDCGSCCSSNAHELLVPNEKIDFCQVIEYVS